MAHRGQRVCAIEGCVRRDAKCGAAPRVWPGVGHRRPLCRCKRMLTRPLLWQSAQSPSRAGRGVSHKEVHHESAVAPLEAN